VPVLLSIISGALPAVSRSALQPRRVRKRGGKEFPRGPPVLGWRMNYCSYKLTRDSSSSTAMTLA
jgi:hypothetical protein